MSDTDIVPASPGILGPMFTLAKRELVRFLRQRSRVASALLQPIIFFLFFGAALQNSIKLPGSGDNASFQLYLFPGTIVMIVMFTAIFSTISIIEDRREGFLQSVLVAPASRFSMVMGKLLGGSILAMMQGALFMLAAFFLPLHMDAAAWLESFAVMALISVALCGLGFLIAWRMDSSQGFHAIMMLFLFPMLILSGAFFPQAGVPGWLAVIMGINPLTYGLATLRHVMLGANAPDYLPGFALSLTITAVFAAATVFGSVAVSATRTTGDLQ